MNFGEILNAVCKDGIDPSRRSDAQQWVQLRHAEIWGAYDWVFKRATASVTFTSGSQVASGPADLHAIFALYDASGEPIRGIRDPRKFFDLYNTLANQSVGVIEGYTVVDSQILVGPVGDGTTGLLVYEQTKPTLSSDSSATGLPDGFDMALVFGARADGFRLTNVPLADELEASYERVVASMTDTWLEQVDEAGGQAGAYRPGMVYPAWR